MTAARPTFPFPAVPRGVRAAVGLTLMAIVYLAYHRSATMIDEGGLFLLMGIAVLFNAWFAGTSTALAATVVGSVIGAGAAGYRHDPAVQTHLALFVGQGLLLTGLVAELRHARRTAEREAASADAARHDVEAASRMKDEFLGTISHELRTPLNAILGWMHLIKTGKLDRATEMRGFEAIDRNVRLQAQLTSDLLDASNALTGRLSVTLQPVSLTKIVGDAVSQAGTAAAAKSVQVQTSGLEQPVVVRGDPNRLRQAVWHLIANAIKFTPRGGTIDVIVEMDTSACVTVSDTGPGIDPDFLPRVFDRFTQADSSPTRVTGGLGVGLSLVRDLIERHGGEIRAENRPDGRGALFSIRLPIHLEDQQHQTVTALLSRADLTSPPLDGIRVLLVDHDRDALELLSVVLQQRGAAVRLTTSVDEALEMLEAWRPDVLLSDTASPDRDAYALIGKVQSLEADRGGRIPALALTTLARTDETARRLLSDVKRDLPKPLEPAVLTAEIARLTGRERRRVRRG